MECHKTSHFSSSTRKTIIFKKYRYLVQSLLDFIADTSLVCGEEETRCYHFCEL